VAVFCSFTVSTHLFSTLSAAKPTQSWLIRVLLTKICWHLWTKKINKNPIKKSMVETNTGETKREGQRKAKRQTARRNQKKRELVPLRERDQKKISGIPGSWNSFPAPTHNSNHI
jgi:hypothetical protein